MVWRAIFFCFALFAVLAFAQESSEPESSSDSKPTEAAPEQPTETASDEEFVPTKEVPADDEVTFPVDI